MRGYDREREEQEQTETDYIYGASSPVCIALIPPAERAKYLPIGEVQRGREDFQDCVTRAYNNDIETKLNFLYQTGKLTPEQRAFLEKHPFIQDGRVALSDRFPAMNSGTTKNGNSLKAPADAIHRYGFIPKALLPARPDMDWDAYHNKADITWEMRDIGLESTRLFPITYERVYEDDFAALIEEDMLVVAGYAWPKPKDGVYPRTERDPGHAWLNFILTAFWGAFDNYEEGPGDFIKHLAPDYNFDRFGYRIAISYSREEAKIWVMTRLVEKLREYIALLTNRVGSWFGRG